MNFKQLPSIEATVRERLGTRYTKRDRAAGLLPAVIYGHKQDPVHVAVNAKLMNEMLHGEIHVMDIKVNGASEHVLIKDLQWDLYSREVVHMDLERVNMDELINIDIELLLTGEAKALKAAGTALDHPTTHVHIKCRADQIPSHLEHNITDLEVNTALTVADLTMPAGVEITTPASQVICQITTKTGLVEEEVEAAEEPEVIGAE